MTAPAQPSPGPGAATPALAPYALRQDASRGRRHPEPEHPFRSPFQRDRDRIVHSRAFRRLEGKTQVFLNGTGDHYRTRLTHTIEVSAIARTLARSLGLNEDLAEAIALAHDLGHTPFGHMGERVLDEQLRRTPLGGFDHNEHALRVVDHLECKYPAFPGLNLTWEVRAGLLKHRTATTRLDGRRLGTRTSLEAQVAQAADDVAYCTHDLDDGLEAGLLTEEVLAAVPLWQMAREDARRQGAAPRRTLFAGFAVRCLIDRLVADILEHARHRLASLCASHPAAGFAPTIGCSPQLAPLVEQLRDTLFHTVYRHPEVMAVNREAGEVVRRLYTFFLRHPEQLGPGARGRVAAGGLERAAADYIAGMTDRYALVLSRRFFPRARPLRLGHIPAR